MELTKIREAIEKDFDTNILYWPEDRYIFEDTYYQMLEICDRLEKGQNVEKLMKRLDKYHRDFLIENGIIKVMA